MVLAKLFEPLIAGLCTKEHEAGLRVSPRSDEKKRNLSDLSLVPRSEAPQKIGCGHGTNAIEREKLSVTPVHSPICARGRDGNVFSKDVGC